MICLRDNQFGPAAPRFCLRGGRYVMQTNSEEEPVDCEPPMLWKILSRYNGKTLSELRSMEPGAMVGYGSVPKDSEKLSFFTIANVEVGSDGISGVPESFCLETSNLMGVLSFRDAETDAAVQMEIRSRFDKDSRQLFLNYMLSRVFQVDFFDMTAAGADDYWKMLVAVLFLQKMKDAIPVGLYKEYRTFEENDQSFKGKLDLQRHLKRNYPLCDAIAYSYRTITFDNPINHLLRCAVEKIWRNWPHLLCNDGDLRNFIASLQSATPSWNASNSWDIGNHAMGMTPIKQPYFAEFYDDLRLLARMILQEEGMTAYKNCDIQVSGVVFDGAWLWEAYVATVLEPAGFVHAEYPLKGKWPIFKDRGVVGMDYVYPDFYSDKRHCVLDTKYKWDSGQREDIFQMLSYAFLTGAHHCGLVYPPGEHATSLKETEVLQHCKPDLLCQWHSFAFEAMSMPMTQEDFLAYMARQEELLCAFIPNVRLPDLLR